MASDTLYECFLLIEACIATIHAYVLTHRWAYETENARSLHVLVWRLQLIFSVCVPTIVFIAWRLFYRRRRRQQRQEDAAAAAVDENKNLDLSVCTAIFCLAMLCLGKESRRGTADADIDDVVMICCLGIIGLVGIILFVWTDHRMTTTTTTTINHDEGGRSNNILLRLFCRRRCHRFYNDDNDNDNGGTRLVFLEGTSCLGKTSLVSPHRSFDMMEYLRREPMYRQKHRLAYWQALYDMELYADLMLFRLTTILARGGGGGGGDDDDQLLLADRSHVSQFCYAVVFAYDGAHSEPHIFAERVDREIFNDPSISMALQRAASSWRKIDERINELATTATTKPLSSTILWCVSAEPKRTAESLLRRANPYELNMLFGGGRAAVASDIARTPEEQRRRVLLTERYVRNQNHVFTRVSRLLQDPLIEVAAAASSSSSFPPLITLDSIERALLPKIRPTTITTTTTTTEENAAAAATTTTTQDDDDDDDDDDDKTNKASAVTITTAATIEKIPPLR